MSVMLRGWVVLVGIGLLGLASGGCRDSSNTTAGGISFREQIAQAKREADVELRAKRLIKIAYQQGKAKDRGGAEETLQIAWKDCDILVDPAAKTRALALMAEAWISLDNRSGAKRAIDGALAAAAKVETPEDKTLALARVAQAQAFARDASGAASTLQSAEELMIAKIDDLQNKTLSLCAIGKAFHELGKPVERDRVFGVALNLAKATPDARKRSLIQAEVAVKQSDLGDRAVAVKTFELALESAGKIELPYTRAYALGDIAKRFSDVGLFAKAREVFAQAEQAAAKVPEADMQMQALQYVRSLMGKLPKAE
jgi:hypothetical protein